MSFRPVSYIFAFLLIVLVASSVFALSVWIWPQPIDSVEEYLGIAGVVIVAVIASLSQLKNIVEVTDKFIGGMETGGFVRTRRFKREYLQHLYYRHRNFDVKGLTTIGTYTLELARVFVELRMVPGLIHEVSKDPFPLPKALQRGNHTIWDYLQAGEGEKHNFAIVGPPGSGKTTMLQHLTLIMTGGEKGQKPRGSLDRIPILLFLRDHVDRINGETDENIYNLEDAIQLDLRKWSKEPPEGWFEKLLDDGNCLVMFDGLDEVVDQNPQQPVVDWVERQTVAYPQCQFVVTSRPHGYRSNPLSHVTLLEMRPYTAEQQAHFIENWYLASEIQSQQKDDEGVRMDAQEGANDLLNRLRNTPKLTELAVNPLLLTMIATVHRYRGSLPERRVELYAEICDVFLGNRQLSKGISLDLTPAQRRRVLQPLAWHMMLNEQLELAAEKAEWVIEPTLLAVNANIKPETFLKSIENESGLLLELESGSYSFSHLTFQEYLAAAHAKDSQKLDVLLPKVTDSWWHETLLLYSAGTDATAIITACLDSTDPPTIDALILAIRVVEEAREVSPSTTERFERIITEAGEDVGSDRARLVARARLRWRLQRMDWVGKDLAIDTSLITSSEYQLFLDEMLERGVYLQPDHWQQNQYKPGEGARPILGVRPSDAEIFCDWLTEQVDTNATYRLPSSDEIEMVRLQSITGLNCVGYWVAKKGCFAIEVVHGQLPTIATDRLTKNYACYIARDIAGDLDIDIDHGLDVALNNALDRAGALDLDYVLASALEFDRALALVRALALTLARALDQNLGLDRDCSLARGFARALTRALTRALSRDPGGNLDQARAVDGALFHDLDRVCALDLYHDLDRALGGTIYYDLHLAQIYLLLLVMVLLKELNLLEQETAWKPPEEEVFQRFRKLCMEIVTDALESYIDLCVLYERRGGKLSSFEGIRLVREQKKDN